MKTITVKAEEINFESKLTLNLSGNISSAFAWHGMNSRPENAVFEEIERLIVARCGELKDGQIIELHRVLKPVWQISFTYFPKEEVKK